MIIDSFVAYTGRRATCDLHDRAVGDAWRLEATNDIAIPSTAARIATASLSPHIADIALGGSAAFRSAFTHRILPALLRFDPELIVLSAGFDGRHGDPVGGKMGLTASDYEWATRALVTASAYPGRACNGRIVRIYFIGYYD